MDDSKLLPDGETIRIPSLDDNLEFQIALDELAAGSETALHHYLARQAGVDPSTVKLRRRSWNFNEEDGSTLGYIGKMDAADYQAQVKSVRDEVNKPLRMNFMADKEGDAYTYSRLNEPTKQIRLLRLGRAELAQPEADYYDHLKVETFDLDSAPPYICLSYVWGAPEKFIPLNCEGKVLCITQNLFHALRNIFLRYPNCYLWADGVCIDQDDLEERACQVILMGQIYSRCKLVVAHPGHFQYGFIERDETHEKENDREASAPSVARSDVEVIQEENVPSEHSIQPSHDQTAIVQDSIHIDVRQDRQASYAASGARAAVSLMNYITRIWEKQQDYDIILDAEWEKYRLPSMEGEDAQTWQNLLEFWEQDWLWRAWVLPECVLPAKVTVMFDNEHLVSLDAIMNFWDNAHKRGLPAVLRHGPLAHLFLRIMHLTPVKIFLALRRQRVPMDSLRGFDANNPDALDVENDAKVEPAPADEDQIIRHTWKKTPDLLQLLTLCRNNRATDDRDKIYALLGLADDAISRKVQPNYTASNTTEKTFVAIAKEYVKAGRGAELLENAGTHHNIENLPSWVPDWTHQSRSRFNAELYTVSRDLESSISLKDAESGRIHLKGVSVSKVKTAGPAWRFYSNDINEPTFMPIRTRKGEHIDIPPFPDEDARCFLVTFALKIAEEPEFCTTELYSGDLEEVVVRALCADCSWSGERLSSSEAKTGDFMNSYRAFRKFYARGPDSDPDQSHLKPGYPVRVHRPGIFHWLLDFSEEEGDKSMKELWPFAMAVQEAMKGRRFALLESGHFAVLPWDAQNGDEVVIAKGSRLPFVLRAVDTAVNLRKENEYELVGDCYVHGIMDGELLVDTVHSDAAQQSDALGSGMIAHDWKAFLPGAQSTAEWEDFIIV